MNRENVLIFLRNNHGLIEQAKSLKGDVIENIYTLFNNELGNEWTLKFHTPTPEELEYFNNGWSDDVDEMFLEILEQYLVS
jgi:hypothetical protein